MLAQLKAGIAEELEFGSRSRSLARTRPSRPKDRSLCHDATPGFTGGAIMVRV